MTQKLKIISQVNLARTAVTQPFFVFLSIIQNFSLGLLWKAIHNKPGEGVFGGEKQEVQE